VEAPRREKWLLVAAAAGLGGGGVAAAAGQAGAAHALWAAVTAAALVPALGWVVASLRRGRPGVDVIAVLALGGTLAVGEYFAGAMIAVMLTSGRALEARAGARAARELQALVARTPRAVHRYEDGGITSPPLESVTPGQLLLVKPGDVVPVDGLVEGGPALLDESALTGEPVPVEHPEGDYVRSGVVNAGGPFDLRATTTAADSTYAGIVRLVEEAQADTAPFVRMADRYALLFLPAALVVAGAAWLATGDPVRAVAVLVVATPCPLILAAPVAIVAGLSRAAARGVVVKGGGALEQLAEAQTLLLDKTGTLTVGHPTLVELAVPPGGWPGGADAVLGLAASLEQASPHVIASALVRAARQRGLDLRLAERVEEVPGQGVAGTVAGVEVAVGRLSWVAGSPVPPWARTAARRAELDGLLTTFVRVGGRLAGALLFDDPIRTDARRTLAGLRRDGIRRIVMVTGDRADTAEIVGTALGLDAVLAECSPADKVHAVELERRHGRTLMVGDGINDAPALATADLGVAMGARGSTASSEAADVVLTVDRLDRLAEAIRIARGARRIAGQSVLLGMGLSLLAMAVAALGGLPPAAGAVTQEVIDLAAILNALRAVSVARQGQELAGEPAALGRRFADEHRDLWPRLAEVRAVADDLGRLGPAATMAQLRAVHAFLADDLLPHEEAEDAELYPALAGVLGGADPTGSMSRAHVEIGTQIRRLGRLLDDIGPAGPSGDDVTELRQLLYGLHAILRLHFIQEEEGYFSLLPEEKAAA